MGFRGGWSWQLQTKNLMEDPQPERSLRANLQAGIDQAQMNKVHAGPEFRNYRRSTRIPLTHRGIQGRPGHDQT